MKNQGVAQLLKENGREERVRILYPYLADPVSGAFNCLLCETLLHYTLSPGWSHYMQMLLPEHQCCPMTYRVTYWRQRSARTLQAWPVCDQVRGWWSMPR